jgi:hypothetical protein
MTLQNEARRAGGAAGPETSLLGGLDSQEIARKSVPAQVELLRLQFLAARLHALGLKPLYHFLDEVERGADLRSHFEKYAALQADIILAYGGDRFPPALHVIGGGGR